MILDQVEETTYSRHLSEKELFHNPEGYQQVDNKMSTRNQPFDNKKLASVPQAKQVQARSPQGF